MERQPRSTRRLSGSATVMVERRSSHLRPGQLPGSVSTVLQRHGKPLPRCHSIRFHIVSRCFRAFSGEYGGCTDDEPVQRLFRRPNRRKHLQ